MIMQVPATQERSGGIPYKWIVAIVIIFGLFMTILDTTIVNIAIPRLQNDFGAPLNSVQWVLTAYTLAQGVATPLTAFLSQRLGQKRLYLMALVGFTLGSVLCGLSINLPMLIFFRIVQGTMGAFMMPVSITLLYSEFPPEERGLALGSLGIPILLAPAIGPTVGGYIITFVGWQLIFFINLPIGIVGLILGLLFLHETRAQRRISFDAVGFLLSTVSLASLLYGLSDASTDGWGSTKVISFLLVGLVGLVIFVVAELRIAAAGRQPLLDLRVFADASFTTSNIASVLVTFALYGGLLLLPLYLQNLRGLSPYQAGLLLLPQAFASMVASLVAGRLVDKIGVKLVVIPGLAILTLALFLFSGLQTTTPYGTVQIWLIIRSFALGFCFQPLSVSAFARVRNDRLPQASSVNTALRFVVSSLAVAVMATLIQTNTSVHYTHLAEQVTASSPLGQLIPLLQAQFVAHGAQLGQAYTAALREVSGLVQLQAAMLAMQDGFRFSAVLAVLAIVSAFFISSPRRKKVVTSNAQSLPAHEAEGEAIREEATLML